MDKEFKEEVLNTLENIYGCLRTVSYSLGDNGDAVDEDTWHINNNITNLKEMLKDT